MSIYTDNGYLNRRDYLDELAEDYGVPKDYVYQAAQLLGPEEDFDGLVTTIQDFANTFAD